MCFSSKRTRKNEPAVEGVAYCISETFYGGGGHRHGVLHREGMGIIPDSDRETSGVVACAACIDAERQVTFINLSPVLMRELGLKGDTLTATFLPGREASEDGTEHPDLIRLKDGLEIPFHRFADPDTRLFLLRAAQAKKGPPAHVRQGEQMLEDA